MGLFNFIKKETYINRLVYNYKDVFQCGDMPAIKNLRYNYSVDELKKNIQHPKRKSNPF